MSSENSENGNSLFWRICKAAKLSVEETKNLFGFITETVTKAVLSAICGALGIEKIGDLNLKIESIKNDSPDGFRRLVDAIIADPVALSKLQRELSKGVQTPTEKVTEEESKDSDAKANVEPEAKPHSKKISAKDRSKTLAEFEDK